jgi:hypothetical protein
MVDVSPLRYIDASLEEASDLQQEFFQSVNLENVDRLLFYLAVMVLKMGGHRYGSFLESANTAAKFAVYLIYLEQGRSLKKTGLINHIEPKRVKAIVQEVENILHEGHLYQGIGQPEPEFLIGIPRLWISRYPRPCRESPITVQGLSTETIKTLEEQIPSEAPQVYILNEMQLSDLLDDMHTIAQKHLQEEVQKPFSEALREHYMFKLLHSGTIIKLRKTRLPIDLYALARSYYTPKDKSTRLKTALRDLTRTFELLQHWIVESPHVLRGVETLDIAEENRSAAIQELDQLLQAWADKYHTDEGEPFLVQLAAGPHNPVS